MGLAQKTRPIDTAFTGPHWWSSEGPPELLSDNLSGAFDLKPIETDQNLGVCRATSWLIDGVLISQAESDATIASRNKWQAENCADLVFVHRYLRGGSFGYAGDLLIEKEPNEIFLLDQELRIELVQTPILVQGLHISKDALGYDRSIHPPIINFSNNHILKQLLSAEMDRLFATLFDSKRDARAALARFLACLKLAIHSPDEAGDVRRRARNALGDLISRHIEQNLRSPDLTVESLLTNFGVSRASLYRIFEDKGGVRQYISDRRLYHALAEIAQKPNERGRINAVAEKWGFASSPSFNRAVKRRFGVAPGALMEPMKSHQSGVELYPKVNEFFS